MADVSQMNNLGATHVNFKQALADDNETLVDIETDVKSSNAVDKRKALTIKERLRQLDGIFPMDEAVIEGM